MVKGTNEARRNSDRKESKIVYQVFVYLHALPGGQRMKKRIA